MEYFRTFGGTIQFESRLAVYAHFVETWQHSF